MMKLFTPLPLNQKGKDAFLASTVGDLCKSCEDTLIWGVLALVVWTSGVWLARGFLTITEAVMGATVIIAMGCAFAYTRRLRKQDGMMANPDLIDGIACLSAILVMVEVKVASSFQGETMQLAPGMAYGLILVFLGAMRQLRRRAFVVAIVAACALHGIWRPVGFGSNPLVVATWSMQAVSILISAGIGFGCGYRRTKRWCLAWLGEQKNILLNDANRNDLT